MHNHCVRQIKLSADEWATLERLAHETYSAETAGQHVRRISWLALLRRIARGELLVVPAKRSEHVERIDAAIAENEHRRRKQETEWEQLSLEAA